MNGLLEMDPIEAEVDAIRQKIWERTKHMTSEERIADLIRRTDPIMKKFHIRESKRRPIRYPRVPNPDWPDD